jgi:P4 family phage/plasmid primase-like protien
MHLARLDNPDDYSELSNEIPSHDIKYLRPFDNIISKLIYRLYGEEFVCSNPEKNEWYYFNGIRWVKENKSFNLRKLMINEVFSKVENYRKQLLKEAASEELVKNYHNILKILGSGYKLNCLELEFYNSNFYKIIDQNKDLIGFENGVYDLTTMQFRKGNSSDYVSLSTGYEFVQHHSDSQEYRDLMELICKIFPNKDVRHFTLKSLSSCLDGHIRDENFYIYSGKNNTGGNGKSTIMDLLLKALGDYACVSPVTLITSKRESANSANSALANIRNKRAVVMQEPESNEQIQAGTMKALTGGDRISTRELHSSQMEFKPHAKFFMCCNKIPAISDIDGGVIRRLRISEFVSRFVDNPHPDNIKNGIYEFKIDKDLKAKLDSYKSVFMCILLDYYRSYKDEGLIAPEPVVHVTKKYENDNNIIKQFIDENIVAGNKQDSISKDQLKEIYKSDSILKSSFGKYIAFHKQLENALCTEFKLDKKNVPRIYGWRIKSPEIDSDAESDV